RRRAARLHRQFLRDDGARHRARRRGAPLAAGIHPGPCGAHRAARHAAAARWIANARNVAVQGEPMSNYEDLTYEAKDGVAVISLNRPQALNAYTAAMGQSLKRAVADAVEDKAVRVIVITGAGRGFCAGADMNLLQNIPAGGRVTQLPEVKYDFNSGIGPDVGPHYHGRFGYLLQARKPVIAAINGPAAGLGLVLALYADLRCAGSEAKLITSFAQRGLIAEHGISWLLPRLIGPAQALDLLFSARKLSAAEAGQMGLVNQVFPQETFM